jgi:hypothetical protein
VDAGPRLPDSIEMTADIRVGDVVIRLVTPRSPGSLYADVLERGPRLYGYTLRVPDIETAARGLDAAGAVIAGREAGRAWVDPASLFGIPLELIH